MWRLDRLGRSLKYLIQTLQDLEQRRVTFVALTERIDTSTPAVCYSSTFRALAEFERDLIRERTMAGLAAAPRTDRWPTHPLDRRQASDGARDAL